MSEPTSVPFGPKALRTAASRVAGAVLSTAKTQFLRADRASERHYESRLDVCSDCPGGHAKFKPGGQLHTCGPMLVSLTRKGVPTCGCLLTRKARDVKQACPFGYWDAADAAAARAAKQPAAVVTGVLQRTLSRRGVIGGGVASLVALAAGRPAFGAEGEDDCYIEVSATDGGEGTHVKCSNVQGKDSGDAFKGKAPDDTESTCYEISGAVPVSGEGVDQGKVVLGGSLDFEAECGCFLPDGTPGPELDVTVSWSGPEETRPLFGKIWENGETKPLCPSGYSCGISSSGASTITGGEVWAHNGIFLDARYADGVGFAALTNYTHGFIGILSSNGDRATELNYLYISDTYVYDGDYGLVGAGLATKRLDKHFGQTFTKDGLTVTWQKGDGPWGCP